MKKIVIICLFGILFSLPFAREARAELGDMGFFGGITEGERLPTTTEQLLVTKPATNRTINNQTYKEIVFLAGEPVEFTGVISVRQQGVPDAAKQNGTYKITYTLARMTSKAGDTLTRNIVFNVTWRREGGQIIRNYTASAWTETIVVGGQSYVLDFSRSHFNVSTLSDVQPGVTYVKGDMSEQARFTINGAAGDEAVYDAAGTLSGYSSAWSNTETMRIDGDISTNAFQMGFQVRPSVSVYKTLQYSKNEPSAISFDGNYREVTQNRAGLVYDIFNVPVTLPTDMPTQGGTSISVYNTFEQLPFADVNALKANPAAADIHKLFSMGVLTGPVSQFAPNQQTRRAEFVTMLIKAAKIPITPVAANTKTTGRNKNTVIEFTFPDVLPTRPDYPYIMAAYENGIAGGRGQGLFYADYPIQREEAIFMLIRTLGLENLGLEPTPATQFADDAAIAQWAKKAVYAARRIGLIAEDEDGNFSPKQYLSKAESAALINAFIEYMRTGLYPDYSEHLVDYTE